MPIGSSSVSQTHRALRGLQRRLLAAVLEGAGAVFGHANLPGYSLLRWYDRCILNIRALWAFVCSQEFPRLLLWLSAWLLASHLLGWSFDLRGPRAAVLPLLGLLWVLPWIAAARRRAIARLLCYRWKR